MSWSNTACFPAPHIIQKCTICFSNGPTHSQRIVSVDMFLVRLVASLGPYKVVRQRNRITKTL